jgi:hypothetical protein
MVLGVQHLTHEAAAQRLADDLAALGEVLLPRPAFLGLQQCRRSGDARVAR